MRYSMRNRVLLLIFMTMLCFLMYSCQQKSEFLGYGSIIENVSDVIYNNIYFENLEMSENVPDYSVRFSILNEAGENIQEKSIVNISGVSELKLSAQIEYFSNISNTMGIYIFNDGIPMPFSVAKSKKDSFYYEFKAVRDEISKIQISLDVSNLTGKSKITIVLMTEHNIMPLYDMDINYAYSVPFNFYVETSNTNNIKKEASNIYSIKNIGDDILKYNTENKTISENEILETSDVTDRAVNTVHILIGKENKITAVNNNKVFITNKIGAENNYELQAFGKKGKYITTLFINNEPYNGFDGKFSVEWEITSEESYVLIPVELPIYDEEYNDAIIYTLTFCVDNINDFQVYESPKQVLKLVGYTPKDELARRTDDNRPVDFGVKSSDGSIMINKSEYQYDGKAIEYDISQRMPEDRFTPRKTLFITVDGIPQDIKVNGQKTKFYNYELLHGSPVELYVMFKPKITLNPDQFVVNIYIINDFDVYQAEKPIAKKFPVSYEFLYKCKNNQQFTSAKDLFYIESNVFNIDDKACIYGQSYIKVYETEKPEFALSPRCTFRIDADKNLKLTYEAYNLNANKYVVFFTFNGEVIPLVEDKKYLMWEMKDRLQLVTFEVEIDKKYIKDLNNINIVTTELNYSLSYSNLLEESIYYLALAARQKSKVQDTIRIDYSNYNFSINMNNSSDENIYINGCNTSFTTKNIKNTVFTDIFFSVKKENVKDIEWKDSKQYDVYYLSAGVFNPKGYEVIFNKYYLYYLDSLNVENITFINDIQGDH